MTLFELDPISSDHVGLSNTIHIPLDIHIPLVCLALDLQHVKNDAAVATGAHALTVHIAAVESTMFASSSLWQVTGNYGCQSSHLSRR